MFIRPETQTLLAQAAANAAMMPKLSQAGVAFGRQLLRNFMALDLPPAPVARIADIAVPAPHGAIPARLYDDRPGDAAARPVIVYYHGGGWVLGDLETHHSLCAAIARQTGFTVLSVDYRLAPEHKFPAAPDDALAAALWAASSPAGIGHKVDGIAVAGDSAGGNLAAVTAQALRGDGRLRAQMLFYPATDMTASGGSMAALATGYILEKTDMVWFFDQYLPSAAAARDPRASPGLAADLAGLAPAIVMTCGLDPLLDQGRDYAARLVRAGNRASYHEAAGLTHGFLNMRGALPSGNAALAAVLADLKAMLE